MFWLERHTMNKCKRKTHTHTHRRVLRKIEQGAVSEHPRSGVIVDGQGGLIL